MRVGPPFRSGKSEELPATLRAIEVLHSARSDAEESGDEFVEPFHILAALIRDSTGVGARTLEKLEVGLDRMQHDVMCLAAEQ